MTEDYLYHYTGFNGFKAILESQAIRFTRLDQLEDLLEGHSERLPDVKKCIYVSCWVKDSEELIPHWKIYSDVRMRKGIRIGLPRKNLFDNIQRTTDPGTSYVELKDPMPNWFWNTDSDNNRFDHNWHASLYGPHEVVYVEDLLEPVKGNDFTSTIDWSSMGIEKTKNWEFEKETRFKITPKGILDIGNISAKTPERHNDILREVIPQTFCIDHPITDQAFNQMKVMYSPLTEESRVATIESLCKEHGLQPPERSKLPIQPK